MRCVKLRFNTNMIGRKMSNSVPSADHIFSYKDVNYKLARPLEKMVCSNRLLLFSMQGGLLSRVDIAVNASQASDFDWKVKALRTCLFAHSVDTFL